MNFSIPSPKIEDMPCVALEAKYVLYKKALEMAMASAAAPAAQILSMARKLEKLLLEFDRDILFALEDKISNRLQDLFSNVNDALRPEDFCKLMYECQAFMDWMLNPKESPLFLLGILKKDSIESIRSNYDLFNRILCKGEGLNRLLDMAKELLAEVFSKIADFLAQKNKYIRELFAKLYKLIDEYLAFLNRLGIFDILDKLDAFAQCVFAACDYADTCKNLKDDSLEKLKLRKSQARDQIADSEKAVQVNIFPYEFDKALFDLEMGVDNTVTKADNLQTKLLSLV